VYVARISTATTQITNTQSPVSTRGTPEQTTRHRRRASTKRVIRSRPPRHTRFHQAYDRENDTFVSITPSSNRPAFRVVVRSPSESNAT
jgi:hypothetical protein